MWRKGANKDLPVTVAELKDDEHRATGRASAPSKEKAKPNRMGLVLVRSDR